MDNGKGSEFLASLGKYRFSWLLYKDSPTKFGHRLIGNNFLALLRRAVSRFDSACSGCSAPCRLRPVHLVEVPIALQAAV